MPVPIVPIRFQNYLRLLETMTPLSTVVFFIILGFTGIRPAVEKELQNTMNFYCASLLHPSY
jgi:hypothetical protein